MIPVKICGITNLEDAFLAVELGAWALGFNFYKKSPRYVSPEVAASIVAAVRGKVITVGVFVNEDSKSIKSILDETKINYAELHGEESDIFAEGIRIPFIKAFRILDRIHMNEIYRFRGIVDYVLLDSFSEKAYGGTGEIANWELAALISKKINIILAGGLTVHNVLDAINYVKPSAIDVCSGVEQFPGRKCPAKLKKFFEVLKEKEIV